MVRMIMQTPQQKPSGKLSPAKGQLIVIFFLISMLFVGTLIKAGVDYHWWLPNTGVVRYLEPVDKEDTRVTLDINTAAWHELILLPKLGEVKAKAIVAYREKHGKFKTLEELSYVHGIGKSIIEAIRDFVKIDQDATVADFDNRE